MDNVLADAYYHKSRLAEHLADHFRTIGSIGIARQYSASAKHWRDKARKYRNA